MATGANATPLGKLHPSIGAKRGFDAGPGAGNGLMPTPGPPATFPSLQGFQPPIPNPPIQSHQFAPGPGFSSVPQQTPGGAVAKPGKFIVGELGPVSALSSNMLTASRLSSNSQKLSTL